MSRKILIATSLLGCDYGRLNAHIKQLEPFSDWFQLDVMDGNFVPNLSVGAMIMPWIKTRKPIDCHLMINNPHRFVEEYAKNGAYSITIHAEASRHLADDIDKIKSFGCRAAVALSPETPVDKIAPVLSKLDMVLVMTVRPGFGGQKFMPECLEKVRWLRDHYPELDIQVDGGVNAETAPACVAAGANILAIGSYITGAADPAEAVRRLKSKLGD